MKNLTGVHAEEWRIASGVSAPVYKSKVLIASNGPSANARNRTKATVAQELIPYLWKSVVAVIPSISIEFGHLSIDFFEMAFVVLECMENSHRNTLDLAAYVQDWSRILLRHEHYEVCFSLERPCHPMTNPTFDSL